LLQYRNIERFVRVKLTVNVHMRGNKLSLLRYEST